MNRFLGIFVSFVTLLLMLVSCEPAEIYKTEEGYVSNIYTVNKATLMPEFEDSLIRLVNDPADFDLKTGDRAHILLYYYYDAYSGKKPEWKIEQVVEKIPTLSMVARDSIDVDSFDMAFSGLYGYELLGAYTSSQWIWNNCLNVNVTHRGIPEKTQFAMTLNGIVNDTIKLNLLGKTEEKGDTIRTKLLTYDLTNIGDLLTDSEKESLDEYDKLKFRVYLKYEDAKGDTHNYSFPISLGEFINPL